MNSILDIHVQRERGQAVTLAPRLPSMFESAASVQETAPAFDPPVRAAPVADAPTAQAEAPRRASPPQPVEPTPEPRRPAPPVPAPVPVPQAVAPAVQQGVVPPARREHPSPVHVPGPQLIRIERETIVAPPAPLRSETAPVAPLPRRAPAPVAALPAAQPSEPAAKPTLPPVAPKVDVRRASQAQPTRASTGQVLPAPQALRVPASRREPAPPAPIARAPDVHITIGRIEVRATTAAPSRTARDHGAAAPMSLDQYLSQRNRKGNP